MRFLVERDEMTPNAALHHWSAFGIDQWRDKERKSGEIQRHIETERELSNFFLFFYPLSATVLKRHIENFAPIGRTASADQPDDYSALYTTLSLPMRYLGERPDASSVELYSFGSEMETEARWTELFVAFCGVSKVRDVNGKGEKGTERQTQTQCTQLDTQSTETSIHRAKGTKAQTTSKVRTHLCFF